MCDHLAALAMPLPTSPEQVDPPEAFDDAVQETLARRIEYADNLRAGWDAADQDPLLGEIRKFARRRSELDRDLRQLVAYGREFVRPRPYTLAKLAEAAGLANHSSARSFYGSSDVAKVAAATGIKARPVPPTS